MRAVAILILGCFVVLASFQLVAVAGVPARSDRIREDFYVTNGPVNAIALLGNSLYIGGDFSRVGPATGGGVPIDKTTGMLMDGFPKVTGTVSAIAPDGSGGWFIGGYFSAVGKLPRNNLAHILPDLAVSSWDAGLSVQSPVNALVVEGNTVYVAGSFGNIGGQARTGIAALDATSGLATAWNPPANGGILALALKDTTLYVGGFFTSIGGQPRNNIAALDTTTGLATAWNPDADAEVLALAVGGSTVYAGGYFGSIGGQSRFGIAALDSTTGLATPWNPQADYGPVTYALAVSGSTVYVGGHFTSIGGQARNNIAALDATTALATPWNPNSQGAVYGLVLSGTTVYAGGGFTSIGGQARNNVAALDTTTGLASSWNPNPAGGVAAMAVSGNTVYLGGYFNIVGGLERNNLAALDVTTGRSTDWNPNASGGNGVAALAVKGTTVYVGGNFTSVGGQARNYVAALDASTGLATPWDPHADRVRVTALAAGETVVYVGGCFSAIGGKPRNGLAAIDPSTGLATPWDPHALDPQSGGGFCFGGDLVERDGIVYANPEDGYAYGYRLHALDATTGLPTDWNPGENGPVRGLLVSGDTVYAGGYFSSIGGQSRSKVGAIDASTGLATPWDPNVTGPESSVVWALAMGDSSVLLGGVFTEVGGQDRHRLAEVDATTGLPTAWNPNPNPDPLEQGLVAVMAVNGREVYAGGDFTAMGGLPQSYIAAIGPADSALDCSGAAAVTGDLWPPNRQLVPIEVSGVTDSDGGPVTITVTGVTQDEPLLEVGTANTCPDAVIVAGSAQVRSERSRHGNGRVYAVSFLAEDGQGGSCTGTVEVCVPHDRGGAGICTDDGQTVNSLDGCQSRAR